MEETTKYQKEWETYKDEMGFGCLVGIFILITVGATCYLMEKLPQYSQYFELTLLGGFILLAFTSFFFGLGREGWKCP